MITQRATPTDEISNMMKVCEKVTTKHQVVMLEEESKNKYCPVRNGNCIAHDCAMFVIDRPVADWRYIEARCTHAGKRPLSFMYGEPKDYTREGEL